MRSCTISGVQVTSWVEGMIQHTLHCQLMPVEIIYKKEVTSKKIMLSRYNIYKKKNRNHLEIKFITSDALKVSIDNDYLLDFIKLGDHNT